jgi:predicted RNase H-like HicB family nuclease
MPKSYTAVVYRDPESGDYVASVPALPGVLTCASTLEELRLNLSEVVALMLEDMAEHGESIGADVQVSLESVEVPA